MFSIIVCTYNGKKTLKATIEKILNQDNYDKYIEQFIIIDNASNDGTADLIKGYKTDKITYFYEPKSGLGNARLAGVNLAKAKWTVFIDDDNELDHDWINNAAEYIKNNPDIAIFCGSVIPKIEFEASDEELQRLELHKGMLACSNLNREQIDFTINKNPFGGIVGAGMTVQTKYLKRLAKNGWIKQMGRTKDNTAAGDDSEISRFITDVEGKKAGYCPKMIMEHNIPKFRLQEDYLLKLNKSLSIGSYNVQSLKKWYVLRRIKQILKYLLKGNPYKKGSLEYKMYNQSEKIYFELIKKDKLVLKTIH